MPYNCPVSRPNDALRFLSERIDYERARSMPASEEAFKLERMRELLCLLDNPHQQFPAIHIAGTKGKGSTAAMTAAVLQAAGYKVGLFTSPHLEHVGERIRIDGQPCPEEVFAELVQLVRPAVEQLDRIASPPTYFEIITAAAFCHFARCKVDVAVLEVGLGGRLDSTNVCAPLLTIITSISFDHTRQLGETLAAIAREKAGIIKPGVPVISGVTSDEPRSVVCDVARQSGCKLLELGVDFDFEYHPPRNIEQSAIPAGFDFYIMERCQQPRQTIIGPRDAVRKLGDAMYANVSLGLIGQHQAANAAIALAAVAQLRQAGWNVPEQAVRQGLADVSWPARVEVLARRPTVILDAAHNVASIKALVEVLEESFSASRRFLIFATTEDKDVPGMLALLLGRFDHVLFTRYQENPRGVAPEKLFSLASDTLSLPLVGEVLGGRAAEIEIAPTPAEAWRRVVKLARWDDLICITGSFFLAAEMRRVITLQPL